MSSTPDLSSTRIPWHSIAQDDVLSRLASTAGGLTEDEAKRRLEKYGPNRLAEEPGEPTWLRFARQFNELMVWILIAAAVIAGASGEVVDTLAILAIVLLNGIIGFVQEEQAEQALAALRKMSAPQAKVVRDGNTRTLQASELVPGDHIRLEAGDNIPADARLLEAFSLRVQEASLTGESTPSEKDPQVNLGPETSLGDRANMIYAGTVIAAGKASAVVVGTGMQTELGHIAGLLQRQGRETTPLQRRLAELGRVLVYVCLALVAIVFALHMWRGGKLLEVFLVSVSLAVAAVPEGLPAVVTLALALGLQRMARRNALVRRLPSVETLGSVTVICTDKTGTLTRNEMTVRAIATGDAQYRLSGTGYHADGELLRARGGDMSQAEGTKIDQPQSEHDLQLLLRAGARCNNAKIDSRPENGGTPRVIGDPTEAALLVAARKAGVSIERDEFRLISELPFDSQRKAMSVLVEEGAKRCIYAKGAPEAVLAMCQRERRGGRDQELTDERRRAIEQSNQALAEQALRVLALAYREQPATAGNEIREEGLTLLGLVGMIDPPRDEAREAVRLCNSAGIRPVMITGDHPATAQAIGQELGILREESLAVSGAELEGLGDDELAARVEQISVYARVTAEHKLRVVKAWQQRGQVVAMTGDGVNDAPAVKAADIGIAMGVTGTDVTKESSDMVLTDDNFRSIVSAVEEGRSIFDNIQNVVHYLLSCNAGEVLFMFFAALVGWPVPLAAIQILWINLVTDGPPALALAMEPPDQKIMLRPPRPPHEPVLTLARGVLILIHGLLIAAAAAIGFWVVYAGDTERLDMARTVAFCIVACSQLVFSLSCRSQQLTLPQLGLGTNPYLLAAIGISFALQIAAVVVPFLQPVFEVASQPAGYWWLIAGLALGPVTIVEVTKLILATVRSASVNPNVVTPTP